MIQLALAPLDDAEQTVLAAIVGEPLPIEGVCQESGLRPRESQRC